MPSRTKPRPSPSYGEGREALLRAAVTVVAAGGLRALTYRAVADEAGVTHGLVRHHFGSRDALIVAATEYSLSPLLVASGVTDSNGDLKSFARGLPTMIQREQELVAFQYEVMLESVRRPELRPAVQAMLEGLHGSILDDLRQRGLAVTPATGAMVTAALDGIVLQGLTLQDPKFVQSALRELRSLLNHLQGTAPDSSSDLPDKPLAPE